MFQVANLSTRVYIAETERAFRTQESWIGPDLQEIQKLNEELDQQKENLLSQIASQAEEIENLNIQLTELRTEVDRLNQLLDQERRKPNFQSTF